MCRCTPLRDLEPKKSHNGCFLKLSFLSIECLTNSASITYFRPVFQKLSQSFLNILPPHTRGTWVGLARTLIISRKQKKQIYVQNNDDGFLSEESTFQSYQIKPSFLLGDYSEYRCISIIKWQSRLYHIPCHIWQSSYNSFPVQGDFFLLSIVDNVTQVPPLVRQRWWRRHFVGHLQRNCLSHFVGHLELNCQPAFSPAGHVHLIYDSNLKLAGKNTLSNRWECVWPDLLGHQVAALHHLPRQLARPVARLISQRDLAFDLHQLC